MGIDPSSIGRPVRGAVSRGLCGLAVAGLAFGPVGAAEPSPSGARPGLPPGWTPVPTGIVSPSPVYGPRETGRLWVSSAPREAAEGPPLAFESADGGRTWAPIPGDPIWAGAVAAVPGRAGVLLTWRAAVAASDSAAPAPADLWRSVDGSLTWATVPLPPLAGGATRLQPPVVAGEDGAVWARLVVAASAGAPAVGGVARSLDGGADWEVVLTDDGPFRSLAVNPADPRQVWVETASVVRRTDDGGATWPLVRLEAAGDRSPGLADLRFDPFDARRLWVVGAGQLWRSVDGGQAWTGRGAVPAPEGKTAALLVDPSRVGRLYAFTGGDFGARAALWATDDGDGDGGLSWSERALPPFRALRSSPRLPGPTDDPLNLSAPPGAEGVLFMGRRWSLWRSEDGGRTWAETAGFNAVPTSVVGESGGQLVAGGALYSVAARSVDRGATWSTDVQDLGVPLTTFPDPYRPGRVFRVAGFTSYYLERSDDGGRTWRRLPPNVWGSALAFDPGDPDRLWLNAWHSSDSAERLHRRDDGGETWEPILTEGAPRGRIEAILVDRTRPERLFVAGAFGLTSTDDAGATWRTVGLPGVDEAGVVHALFQSPAEPARLLAAHAGGVAASADGGETWRSVPDLPGADSLLHAQPEPPGRLIVAATWGEKTAGVGRLFQSLDAGRTWRAVAGPHTAVEWSSRPRVFFVPGAAGRVVVASGAGTWLWETRN